MHIQNIFDLSATELEQYLRSLGEPAYRADQVLGWIYRKLATSFSVMSDIPQSLRRELSAVFVTSSLAPVRESISRDRQTRKVLFRLYDGKTIESSYMSYHKGPVLDRGTVCVSTQVGCGMGCPFCATGQQGFERNLSAGEIIEQVLYFNRTVNLPLTCEKHARPVTNVVFMGMGEPLANYDSMLQAVAALNSNLGIGIRQITVSTSGLVPQIERLARESLHIELAISLHAADDELRNRLVPVNRKYPLERLMESCRNYQAVTGRRITFEYALFRGLNDSPAQARELAELIRGLDCHVNLIASNPTTNRQFAPPARSRVLAFQARLTECGTPATVRAPRGGDIEAGCGQLRSRELSIVRPFI